MTPGASVRFGVPFSEFDTVFFGIGVERTEIKGATAMPEQPTSCTASKFGETSTSVPLTVGWTRDRRDSALVPDRRHATSASTSTGASPATRATCAPTCSTSSTCRSRAQFTFAINGELG